MTTSVVGTLRDMSADHRKYRRGVKPKLQQAAGQGINSSEGASGLGR